MVDSGRQSLVYLVDRYPELSQTFVHDEIVELRRQGHQVTVVALRPGDEGEQPNFSASLPSPARGMIALAGVAFTHPRRVMRVFRLLKDMEFAFSRVALAALPMLLNGLQAARPDRVHAHFAWGASSVGAYLAAYLDVPMSMTVHARDLYVDPQALPAKYKAANLVVTVCEFNRGWLVDHGCPPDKIAVVPCGVALPAEMTSRSPGLVLGVGRLVPKKGFDVLVAAAAEVQPTTPRLRVEIIGDGPERARLEKLVEDLGLQDTVTLHGALEHSKTLDLLSTASVFALPCRVDTDGDSDAMPVVIREAMARAIPVATTAVAGIPETVSTEVGWLVASDDPREMARAIVQALHDPEDAAQRGLRGRARVSEQYTIADSVRTLVSAFTAS